MEGREDGAVEKRGCPTKCVQLVTDGSRGGEWIGAGGGSDTSGRGLWPAAATGTTTPRVGVGLETAGSGVKVASTVTLIKWNPLEHSSHEEQKKAITFLPDSERVKR